MDPSTKRSSLSTGVTLSFVDRGDSHANEALVFLPGLGDSWRTYEVVLRHVPPPKRAIAVSLRGHGDSDKPPAGYAIRDYASDIGALLDALGIRRAVLVGHSSASLVARRYALDHPDRVAGLVLEASFVTVAPDLTAKGEAMFGALEDPISREFVRGFVASTFVRPVDPSFVEAMTDEALKAPARVWRETFSSLARYDDARELGSLRVPTLIPWGDRDTIIDRTAAESLARAIPSAKLVVYDGVGHTPHWEAPERFARDVLSVK